MDNHPAQTLLLAAASSSGFAAIFSNISGENIAALCNVLATILAVIASAIRRERGGKGGEK